MPRRIKRAKIHTIALCRRGANRLPGLYKSEKAKGGFVFETTVLKTPELLGEGLLTTVIYSPEMTDSQNDIASAEVIKDMAHGFFREGGDINLEHDGTPVSKEDAYPAESFVIQKADPRFQDVKDSDGNPVDVTGGWGMVIKLENHKLRMNYASGEWNGVSMEGSGEFEAPAAKTYDFGTALAARMGLGITKEVEDMTPEEMEALIKKSIEGAVPGIVDTAVKAALKKSEPEKVELDPIAKSLFPSDEAKQKIAHAAIELAKANGKSGMDLLKAAQEATVEKTDEIPFEGDRSNPADLIKHAKKLEAAALMKSIDFTDPAAVKKFADDVAEKAKSDEGDELSQVEKSAGVEVGDTENVKDLKLQLFKAEGGSKQTQGKGDESQMVGMSKSESDLYKQGEETADWVNSSRGMGTDVKQTA